VTSDGSPYARFRRALVTQNLAIIAPAAAGVPRLALDDALEVLWLMAHQRDPRFERAAMRWMGRLLLETPTDFRDARFALVLIERLPDGKEALHRLARRR
jgi:hypothetical protein